jgi:hypothetical protein
MSGNVGAGIGHDHDVRVTGLPVPGGDQPVDHRPQLIGGDSGGVVDRAQPHRIQHRRP